MSQDITPLSESLDGLTISTRHRSDSLFTTYKLETEEKYGTSFAPARYGEGHRYYLPVDEEELVRQSLCDRIWCGIDQYIRAVPANLPPGIFLDLGAGHGIWAGHVASLFPSHQVIGLDLHYDFARFESLQNCFFEVDNYEAPFTNWGQPVRLIHLRDSYFSLRQPRQLAYNVFRVLSSEGWFVNEEMRLDNWTSESPKFNDWRNCTMKAARRLGIPLHSAQDIETSFRDEGFLEVSKGKFRLEASGETTEGKTLLEIVKLTVKASVRILVEGGSCESTNVRGFVEEVVQELEGNYRINIEAEVYIAQKPASEGCPC